MHKDCPYLFFTIIIILCFGFLDDSRAKETYGQNSFFSQINIPTNLIPPGNKKIVVAIVDDGIRNTHIDLRDFIWQNPYEIPENFIDDDGNGVIDDINGWDVADNDNITSPSPERLLRYYHGTHLAGIITRIAQTTFGPQSSKAISIMPVKCLSDDATSTAIRDGYKGIDYAVRSGADIILCAWSVGHISPEEENILRKASNKGVLIIGSVGNFSEEREMYPAAASTVVAVSSLDHKKRISSKSNYGGFVDISAPGETILSSSTKSDDSYITYSGTSQAAAIVTGAAAVMKAYKPLSLNKKILACLKNTSTPLELTSDTFSVKQGAGLVNLRDAIGCLDADTLPDPTPIRPQGYLDLSTKGKGAETWTIRPPGKFKGIWFLRPKNEFDTLHQTTIDYYTDDDTTAKPFATFSLDSMPLKFFVPGTKVTIKLRGMEKIKENAPLFLEYRAEGIDFRTLYCSGTKYLYEEGIIDDNSGSLPYSAGSGCKWQIVAPEGKVVHFKFTEFDTEANTDLLYFFNGEGTHELIMAIFSGTTIPPELTTWSNKVLVWFVTNSETQGQGWKGEFTFIDKDKAQ